MPLHILSDTQAIQTLKANVGATWPRRGSHGNRIEPLAKPIFAPTFRLIRGEKIFTIGSCFARNVEDALIERGFELPSRAILRSDERFAAIGPNVLNNYGVPSIFNEVAWGLGLQAFVPEQNFFELDGKFVDVHLNHALRPASYETVAARRAAIAAAYAGIRDCRVVVITLGLSECWYDTQTALYLNTAPRRALVRLHPERFQLHVLDFAETKVFLAKTVEMLRDHGHADLRLILTVSPVPLMSTYRPQDVVVANMYSKSVLRAAAEEIVAHYDFVDYFPSFESVLTSQRDEVWEDNLTHIKKPIVDLNVSRMIAGYVEAEGASDDERSIDAWLLRLGAPDLKAGEIFGALEVRADLLDRSPDLALLFSEAAVKLKRVDAARLGLSRCVGCDPLRSAWVEAQVACLDEDFAAAEAILAPRKDAFATRTLYWRMLADCLARRGAVDAVREAVVEWSVLFPRSAEPYRVGAKIMAQANRSAEADYFFQTARAMALEDERAVDLEYAEFLGEVGRPEAARAVLAQFTAVNPQQAVRREDLDRRLLAEIHTTRASDSPDRVSANGLTSPEPDVGQSFTALRAVRFEQEARRKEELAAEKTRLKENEKAARKQGEMARKRESAIRREALVAAKARLKETERATREHAKAARLDERAALHAGRRDRKMAAIVAIEHLAATAGDVESARRELENQMEAYQQAGWCGPDNDDLRMRCKAAADAARAAIDMAAAEAARRRRRWWQVWKRPPRAPIQSAAVHRIESAD